MAALVLGTGQAPQSDLFTLLVDQLSCKSPTSQGSCLSKSLAALEACRLLHKDLLGTKHGSEKRMILLSPSICVAAEDSQAQPVSMVHNYLVMS